MNRSATGIGEGNQHARELIHPVPSPGRKAGSTGAAAGFRRPKILHVINSIAVGGTENVVLNLMAQLKEFEHEVCCIRNYDSELVRSRLEPGQLRALKRPHSRFSVFIPQLVKVIRSSSPDIVHSRNWGAIEAVFAARLARVPVVIHSEHGYELETLAGTPLRQQWTRRVACSLADAFLTVSRELRDFHARQAGIAVEKIRVVYNGVDTERFAPRPEKRNRIRAELGFGSDEFLVGAVGRMVPIKDYKTLIRAAERVANKNVPVKVLLVGDGPEVSSLKSFVEAIPGLQTRVLQVGCRNDIADLLAGMDAFVQCSLREGMSNTVLEAMSSGLPVVVTDVGGNREIVASGEVGWLFQPGDVKDLSQLLLALASDGNLRACLGGNARRRVQQLFSHEKMVENYRKLYMELASKRNVVNASETSDCMILRGNERA